MKTEKELYRIRKCYERDFNIEEEELQELDEQIGVFLSLGNIGFVLWDAIGSVGTKNKDLISAYTAGWKY